VRQRLVFDLVQQVAPRLLRAVGGVLELVEQGTHFVVLVGEGLEDVACHVVLRSGETRRCRIRNQFDVSWRPARSLPLDPPAGAASRCCYSTRIRTVCRLYPHGEDFIVDESLRRAVTQSPPGRPAVVLQRNDAEALRVNKWAISAGRRIQFGVHAFSSSRRPAAGQEYRQSLLKYIAIYDE
jgi:hypothetical protein